MAPIGRRLSSARISWMTASIWLTRLGVTAVFNSRSSPAELAPEDIGGVPRLPGLLDQVARRSQPSATPRLSTPRRMTALTLLGLQQQIGNAFVEGVPCYL
jgi:hypothetical protein